MLISDSHQFIFVQIRRAASSSIQSLLRPYVIPKPECRWAHLKSRIGLERDYRKYVFRTHEEMLTAQKLLPAERFQGYFKFAILRTPWERLVSEYEYILSQPSHGRHHRVRRLGGFPEFVRMQIPRRDAYQLNMVCDRQGKLLLDYVGSVETLNQDWRGLCSRLQIPHSPLPLLNTVPHCHYQKYYTPELRTLVAQHWNREIELFGYRF